MSEKIINPDCPCKSECVRHGDCEACKANHMARGSLTACQKLENQNSGG